MDRTACRPIFLWVRKRAVDCFRHRYPTLRKSAKDGPPGVVALLVEEGGQAVSEPKRQRHQRQSD